MSDDRKGISGNTSADLREVAAMWDESARFCNECYPGLSARDLRFAAAMRKAADILDSNTIALPADTKTLEK